MASSAELKELIRKLDNAIEGAQARIEELPPLPPRDSLDKRDVTILAAFAEAEAFLDAALRARKDLGLPPLEEEDSGEADEQ
jgi:hypothetical protein